MADDIDDTQDGGGSTPTQNPAPPDVGGTVAPPGPIGDMFTGQSGVVQSPGGPQRPSYFKNIIKGLGLVLSQGALAGVQAPLNPQGPPIAAATAANMPQARFEQGMRNKSMMNSQQLQQLSIAQGQLTLHQLQSMALTLPENQQEALYNTMRDQMKGLTGKVEELATGSLASVQDELGRRQRDANASGQKGLLSMHILPAVDSTYKDQKYTLWTDKGTLTEDIPEETLTPTDLGYDKDEAKAAGLSNLKLPKIPAGTKDWQRAQTDRWKQIATYQAKSETQMGQWNRTKSTITSREDVAQKGRDLRWKIADLNAATSLQRQRIAQATKDDDKELLQADQEIKTHLDKLADIQKTTGVAAWLDIGGGKQRAITTENRAIADARARRDAIVSRRTAGGAVNAAVNSGAIKPTTEWTPTKVPKGTKITPDIINKYKAKYGTGKPARDQAIADGYDPASFARPGQ